MNKTMTRITGIIGRNESITIEWKPSLSQIKDIIETVSAFANTEGGKVIVGVSKSGKVMGVEIGKGTIEVPESTDKLILAFGRPYKRVGKSTVKMSKDEYERLILEKHKEKLQFDTHSCLMSSIKDIDKTKFSWFLRKAKAERNFDIDPEISINEGLARLNLIENGKLSNTAILLFGKEPQRFILQAKIRAGRFKDVNSLDFIDMKVLDGTIPELREKAMKFIMEHIKRGVFFDDNRRYDKWEYPLRALEEVLNNALAHRDYFSNAEIHLSIYDDRIEVWNPGELLPPLRLNDLKKEHKSIPRNRFLADKLFLIKYIEEWGRGTNRIVDEMLENKLPEPEFKNYSGGFAVVLYGPGKSFEEKIEKEKLHILEINERQKKAIEYLKEKGHITNKEYQNICNTDRVTAFRDLKDLVRKEIIKKIGKTGKWTYYELKR